MNRLFLFLLLFLPNIIFADATLYSLINERLSHMKQVAANKWISKQPIAAAKREKTVLDNAVKDGLKYGITKESSRLFFRTQMEAAKNIQRCWFNRWETTDKPENPKNVLTKTRQTLTGIGSQITKRLAKDLKDKDLYDSYFSEKRSIECFTANEANNIYKALNNITFYPDRYTQVLSSKKVRIGTTGDYAPFSYSEDNVSFTGIDIDLAENLAKSLGVEAVFIKTSWPTLMDDLYDGSFDIGMSGISIIPSRTYFADFSMPYHVGGKSPMTLCSRVSEFNSLKKIDRPGVRAIVNPGGTNERFLDKKMQYLTKVLYADNRRIFEEIIERKADLMITDKVEVDVQSKLHPELCGSMPDMTLTYQEKGYMIPKDPRLKLAVNQWLKKIKSKNLLEKTFELHLN